MGFLDALSDLGSAVVKTALSPIAIVKDAASIVTGEEAVEILEVNKEIISTSLELVESKDKEIEEIQYKNSMLGITVRSLLPEGKETQPIKTKENDRKRVSKRSR